ncbi:MAG: hypothetical protein JXX28_18350 [Deltaproteobacteria bacterium]|nr:hypothetical protein [Deltaproteobacteria bacterium]
MDFALTPEEWEPLSHVPELDLIALAVELDVVAPARVDPRSLFEQCVLALVDKAKAEGLPFSKYDAADLAALPPDDLTALGRLQGIQGAVTADAVLKVGKRVFKLYSRQRPESQVALFLPMLLTAVARVARLTS